MGFGDFIDDITSGFGNSGNIKNPFDSGSSSIGSAIGNFLGDAVDTIKKAAGEIAAQFPNKEAAEDSLFNKEPTWLDPSQATSVGMDDRTDKTYPTMTQIRNFVRAELLRRQHNFGIAYPGSGEYAGEMNFNATPNEDGNATKYTMDIASFDYDTGHNGGRKAEMFLSDDYVGKTYKGPKAAWTRVVSNSLVPKPGKDGTDDPSDCFHGFVLHGVDNFDEMYGFVNPVGDGTPGDCVLGYDCQAGEGLPLAHRVEERDFKHRPAPGITGIDSEEMGVGKNQKKTTVKFTAWSRSQVDYLDPYFFTPGNTMLVEWGWNTFPRTSLIDITDVGSPPETAKGGGMNTYQKGQANRIRKTDPDYALKDIKTFKEDTNYEWSEGSGLVSLWNSAMASRKQIRNGQGNYSFTLGMISNYTYGLRDDGGYDCTVEIMSMAFFCTQLGLAASGQKPGGEVEAGDNRQLNLREFIDTHLAEMVKDGDSDPDEWFDDMSDGAEAVWDSKSGGNLRANGRYFSFGLKDGGWNGTEDNKQYMAGSPSDGAYITVGYLIDIFNVFFGKKSEDTEADIFKFVVENKRCSAHPNIKSVDGSVLLIPNSMAPRHNLKNFKGTTIGLAGEGDKDGFNDKNPINHSVAFDTLAKAGDSDPQTKAFMAVVEAMNPGSSVTSLKEAMELSPRDDIHRLMTLHPELDEGDTSDDGTSSGKIKPFPDYAHLDDGVPSLGYSGRIQDLFVEFDVVREAVFNNQNVTTMLKTILKKMSTAAGGIWDFDLVGEDPGNPNNTNLTIQDMRLSTNTVDEVQRSDQTYVFKAHQKNSIVRSMSCDISIPGDVAGMVLYGKDSDNPNSQFFARKPKDRVLVKANDLTPEGKDMAKRHSLMQGSSDIASEEKFLVGIMVYHGATGIEEEFRKGRAKRRGKSYTRDDGSGATTGTWVTSASTSGLDLDEVAGGDDAAGTKSGGSTDGWGWSEDGKVIDIEFVDPSKDRMVSLMRKDKNPKNCVKYNMALDGIELSMQLDGIEGIRLWDMFNCTGVPTRYYMNGLWRVTAIKQSVSGNDWTTDITAQFAPNSADGFATD